MLKKELLKKIEQFKYNLKRDKDRLIEDNLAYNELKGEIEFFLLWCFPDKISQRYITEINKNIENYVHTDVVEFLTSYLDKISSHVTLYM